MFYPLNKWLTINQNLSVLGWRVSPPSAAVLEDNRLGRLGTYSRYDVVIEMARDWRYCAWKLGVLLLLILLMAYGVYYIPPNGVPQQVAVGMTSMLTPIAYMLTLGSSLPKISYLTRADRLFVGCAVVVFLGPLKAILALVCVQRDAGAALRRIDRFGRVLYPDAVLLVVLTAVVL